MPDIDHARLRELLDYDQETGVFTRLKAARKSRDGGVGWTSGYHYIRVDRTSYLAHRLAWFFVHGEWPEHDIDHINGDKRDNRLCNLRKATRSQNMANTACRAKSGYKGVVQIGDRYRAQITINRKPLFLGFFASPEAAHAEYMKAAKSAFGDYSRSA